MAGIRDDSAGNYGQWDSSDLSWLDFIKATGSDVGNGAYNALSNITGALSPIGTSPEGNMSLQVPPMITGIADSYRRLSDPTGPGNAYRLTGVPELDAPIQKDMSDVLLSFTGGQAIGGLGRAALPKRGMNRIERTVTDYDFPMYRMTDNAGTEIARAQFDELPNAVRVKDLFVDPSHRGQGVASTLYGHIQDDLVKPMTPDYTLTPDGFEFWKNSYPEAVADYRFDGQTYRQPGPLRAGAETGAVESYRMSGGPNRDRNVLWSDTGKPSIFGSALATAGEQPRNALGAGAMREAVEQQPVRAYRGFNPVEGRNFTPKELPLTDQFLFSSSSPDVAGSYAGIYANQDWITNVGAVAPVEMNFKNPKVYDARGSVWNDVDGTTVNHIADKAARDGHDGLIVNNVLDALDASNPAYSPATTYVALQRGTVKSPLTGETLFSDTGKPSIFGSAAATAGELPMDPASRMARAREMGFDTEAPTYRGINGQYNQEVAKNRYYQMFTDNPREAAEYGSNVIDAYLRRGKNLSVDAGGRNFNAVPTSGLPQDFSALGEFVRTDQIAHKARDLGFDSVTFNNVFDNATDVPGYAPKPNKRPSAISDDELLAELGVTFTPDELAAMAKTPMPEIPQTIQPWERAPASVDVIFDPSNIRSVNAAFDPAKKDSANLLAGKVYGVPQYQKEEEKIPYWLKF